MTAEERPRDLEKVRFTFCCPVSWETMEPLEGEHVRHCSRCDLPVYDFSKMTRSMATKIVEQNGGGMCAFIRRRRDGALIILEDRPPVAENSDERADELP